jgi:predicted enzyme related to lactoylglutathione lyase
VSRKIDPQKTRFVRVGMLRQHPIAAILIPVSDWRAGLDWYQSAFPSAKRIRSAEIDFEFLELEGCRLEIVLADETLPSGAAGSVVYWRVADLDVALAEFKALGATLYRGPMQIEGGEFICQVRDPWGNCIGLRGSRSADA